MKNPSKAREGGHLVARPRSSAPATGALGGILFVLMIGTFLAPLDSSIVNITLPSIASEFGTSLSAVSWVATAYLLTNASLLLSMGRLGDLWGLRRVYVTGMLAFGAGSLLCAFAPSLAFLIGARVAQAIGASMLFAAGPALVTRTVPPERRGAAIGLISLSVSAGLTVGPSLGGFLVQAFGWPSVFLVNVPLSIIVAIFAWRLLPVDEPRAESFDFAGAILGGSALLVLLLAMGDVESAGPFSAGIIGGTVLAVGLGIAFVWWEQRATHPMLDLRLFRSRTLSTGVAAATLSYLSLFSVTFTMPFYLLGVRGLQPGVAGLLLTATPLSMAVFAPLSGRLSDRWGSRGLATSGMVVLAVGLLGLSFLTVDSPIAFVPAWLLVVGTGMALFQSPNTAAVLRSAPPTRVGVASALVAEARNVGMALGIAMTAAIIGITVGTSALDSAGGHLLPETATMLVRGMSIAMRVSAGLALVAAVVSWERSGTGES